MSLVADEFVFWHYLNLHPEHANTGGIFVLDPLSLPAAARGTEVARGGRRVTELDPLSAVFDL